MKAKTKPHNLIQPNTFQHVDFHEQPAKEDERRGVRVQKRFFTSKHEDIDRQDNVSSCLSIEKELPELAIRTKGSHYFDQNLAIKNLINENKLKDEALAKATKMITLLKQENSELNIGIQQLQIALVQKDSLIESLENELRLNTSEDKNMSKDVMTERNRHSLHIDSSKSQRRTPRQEKSKDEKVKSRSQLFFDFTHSKQKQNGVKKSQNTVFITENPTFKEIKDINISKKLTPYCSKNIAKNATETGQNAAGLSLTEQIGLLVLQQQIQNNRYLLDLLKELASIENQDLLQFQSEFERIHREIAQEQQEEQLAKAYFKNLQKSRAEMHAMSNEDTSKQTIIKGYQQLIYQYREYAAFLKSYLCESLNFIHSDHYCIAQLPTNINFTFFLKKIAKDISRMMSEQANSLWLQNKELKTIIEQLIKNIEITRKKQISIRSWNQYQLPLSSFQ